ncbi:Mitochondrial distribution and morphology protein 10, partial [Dissostichus eleginoides]
GNMKETEGTREAHMHAENRYAITYNDSSRMWRKKQGAARMALSKHLPYAQLPKHRRPTTLCKCVTLGSHPSSEHLDSVCQCLPLCTARRTVREMPLKLSPSGTFHPSISFLPSVSLSILPETSSRGRDCSPRLSSEMKDGTAVALWGRSHPPTQVTWWTLMTRNNCDGYVSSHFSKQKKINTRLPTQVARGGAAGMERRRGRRSVESLIYLSLSGPGSLCQALQADHVVQDYYKNRSLEEAEP